MTENTFTRGDVFTFSLPMHLSQWDGSVCEDALHWRCGATEQFRKANCISGSGCMSTAVFRPAGPVMRSLDKDIIDLYKLLDKGGLNRVWILFHSGYLDAEDYATRRVAEVCGIYVVEHMRTDRFVGGGNEARQAIIQPIAEGWARFPRGIRIVNEFSEGLPSREPRLKFMKQTQVEKILDIAKDQSQGLRQDDGWTRGDHDRLIAFYNRRHQYWEDLQDVMTDISADVLKTLGVLEEHAVTTIYSYDTDDEEVLQENRVDVRTPGVVVEHRELDMEESMEDPPQASLFIDESTRHPNMIAKAANALKDYDSDTLSGRYREIKGPVRSLPYAKFEPMIEEVSRAHLLDPNDVRDIVILALAGEPVLVNQDDLEDVASCLSGLVGAGRWHHWELGPLVLSFDDLWNCRGSIENTPLTRSVSSAWRNRNSCEILSLAGIESSPYEAWASAFRRWMESGNRPANWLCLLGVNQAERASVSLRRWAYRSTNRSQANVHRLAVQLSMPYQEKEVTRYSLDLQLLLGERMDLSGLSEWLDDFDRHTFPDVKRILKVYRLARYWFDDDYARGVAEQLSEDLLSHM